MTLHFFITKTLRSSCTITEHKLTWLSLTVHKSSLYIIHLKIFNSSKYRDLCVYTVPLNLPENTDKDDYFIALTISDYISLGS